MEGQDILDISEKMIGQLIPPIGKQLLFLREQAVLKGSAAPSKLDDKPRAGTHSPSTRNSSEEIISMPTSSTSGEKSTSQTDSSSTGDGEMSQPHNPSRSDENPGDFWNDLQDYK